MKVVRLILGILTAMVVQTIAVESIEFLIVKAVSKQSMEYLSNNQSAYFNIRNQTWTLILKVVYTFLAAFLTGWLGNKITKHSLTTFITVTLILQGLAFFYAMFFSQYKDTLPTYYWLLLLIVVLSGIYMGHNYSKKKHLKKNS